MNDLAITMNARDSRHLYEQIYEYIRDEIKEGKLLTNEKLPSTRLLAEYLQVSRSTVTLAYDQLLSEGYIEARPQRGFFVCKIEDLYQLEEALSGPTATEKQEKSEYLYDFSPNDVDMGSFPFGTWRKMNKEILIDDEKELFALGNPQGDPSLRNNICRYLHSSRGVNCNPEQVVVGAGNDYLLLLLGRILDRKCHVAMDNPTYKKAYRIFQSYHYDISMLPMDEGGMKMEELQNCGANLVYVMPAHQFPTGLVMPIGRRTELLNWAAKEDNRYIIEDDYDAEFRYKGKPIPSLQASDRQERVIYIGTFSKAIAPAIRVSYMVLPKRLLKAYRENCGFFSSTVSRLDQEMLNRFIAEGAFERHLNKMRKIYKARHDAMLSAVKRYFPNDVIVGENAGLHILLRMSGNVTEKGLLQDAAAGKVRIYALSDSYVGEVPKDAKPTLILGYAGLTETQIEDGVRLLSTLLRR